MDAQVAKDALDGVIHQITIAAMELQGAVGDRHAGIGGQPFGHGGKARLVGRPGADLGGGLIQQGAGGGEVGFHVGKLELGGLKIGDRLAELAAFAGIGDGFVKRALAAAEAARADVEAATVEAGHGDGKALAFGADAVGNGHADAIEIDLRCRVI